MTKWRLRAASAIAVAGCMAVGAAESAAADWYLRAGIGLDRPGKTIFTDRDCSSASPAALYGCGTGGDGAPYRSVGHFGTMIPLELGLGYAVAPAARLEVLVEYRPRFAFKGRANFLSPESRQSVTADLSSFAGMVAAYIDLPGVGVPKIGPFGPFVGAGLGVARHPDRADPRDVSGDDDDRSGRRPDRSCMDGDSRGGGGAGRAGDGRPGLALYRPRGRPYRAWRGPGDLAGRNPGAAAARSGVDTGKARGPRFPDVAALFVLRRLRRRRRNG